MNARNMDTDSCAAVRDEALALLYGEEPSELSRREIREHLAACPDCRTLHEDREGVLARLDAWEVPKLWAEELRPRRRSRLLKAAAAAAVVLVLLGGALVVAETRVSTSGEGLVITFGAGAPHKPAPAADTISRQELEQALNAQGARLAMAVEQALALQATRDRRWQADLVRELDARWEGERAAMVRVLDLLGRALGKESQVVHGALAQLDARLKRIQER